ncbi:unnamed protein product [Brassica oleracea]
MSHVLRPNKPVDAPAIKNLALLHRLYASFEQSRLVINSQRLKLTWERYHVPKHGQDGWKYQQRSVAQSVLPTPPMQQHMHPAPPNQDKPYYPSMDPQRMGGSSTSKNNRAYMMPPRQP